jgi:tryptophan-rich sensory protein
LHQIGAACIELGALWFAIGLTIATFHRRSQVAAWLLLPYFLWVSFAGMLNFAIWRLN